MLLVVVTTVVVLIGMITVVELPGTVTGSVVPELVFGVVVLTFSQITKGPKNNKIRIAKK